MNPAFKFSSALLAHLTPHHGSLFDDYNCMPKISCAGNLISQVIDPLNQHLLADAGAKNFISIQDNTLYRLDYKR